ncbi:phosphatase [Rhodococcus phage Trina]|uniref:ADP ribose-1-P processing protein n=1 Tax=Rhodococcus phage Trina TaxID=2027905 RepID=A0A2D1A2J6_9CAUD|nr:phosphatase [Rhodococcus phage Trina]ASZ75032.1 ADP ribose-1-P processing protein [Rhodococcus phage Trina]
MIKHFEGDLFTSESEAIGHGVNTWGIMGGGIAVEFRKRYPDMYEHYNHVCKNTDDADLVGKAYIWYDESGKVIANLFSQDKPGPNARYSWTMQAIKKTLDELEAQGITSLAIPKIGSGIGGLKWADMYYYLVDEFNDHPVDLHLYI